jgi:hypothetical protein
MRAAPKLTIEFDDPALYVDDNDIVSDSRGATATVRFKVKNRDTNAVIKTPVQFRSIGLNARLS